MSYVQIEIGGQKRGLKFNNYAIEQMLLKQGSGSDAESTYAMVYGGLRGNSYEKEQEVTDAWENVIDWVDELMVTDTGAEEIGKVLKAMTESQLYKKYVTNNPKLKKKSAPGTQSVRSQKPTLSRSALLAGPYGNII